MESIHILRSNISTAMILNAALQVVFYVIGIIINAKIVLISWRSKEHNKSWQLHILYSVSCTLLFAFDIPFWVFALEVPHLSSLTGEWVCYLALFINTLLINIILMNSLMVAITKYIFVVHWDKALAYGHEQIQWIIFTTSLSVEFSIAIFYTAVKRYADADPVHSCFGIENTSSNITNYWDDRSFFWCTSKNIAPSGGGGYMNVVILQLLCIFTSIVHTVANTNLPEAFLYYKIFKKMKRYGTI